MGVTRGRGTARPLLRLGERLDGAQSKDGRVIGCYLHGLFAADGFRHAFLTSVRRRATSGFSYEHMIDQTLDALADHLEAHLDLDRILEIARAR